MTDGSRIERVLREVVEAQREITAVAGDLDATMRAIVERCQRLVGADAAGIEWVEGDEIVLRVVSGGFLRFAGMRMRIDDSVSGRCLETGELQECKDTETDDRVDRDTCRRTGIRSLVMAPLRRNGRAAGNLVVASRSPRAFDDVAVETTRLMGEFVSTAINNAEELAARKALVDALRESEERFRGAFDSAAIGMALTSLEARFVQVNDKLAEMLGYTAEELTHLGVGDVTHPEDIDYDLDGWADIFVANGHVEDDINKVQSKVTYAQPTHLFRNLGNKQFREVTADAGTALAKSYVARGAAYGDFDRDGDLDVLMTTNNGPAYLFRNDGGNQSSYLRIRLRGSRSNRNGFGTLIQVTAGGKTQDVFTRCGMSYLSQSESTVTFGLGKQARAEKVRLSWPSGALQDLGPLEARREYLVDESQGLVSK